ncbi:MAG: aminotransferase class V-fold PLP-dependent enzyme [Flavobacteriales bacterium]
MFLKSQKHLFNLSKNNTYLNGAYMSPLLKEVEKTGIKSIGEKRNPHQIETSNFFESQTILKKRFAQLIQAPDYRNIAIIPSASYGIATVTKNITLKKGEEVIVLDEQFPSNIYSWKRLTTENQGILTTIKSPKIQKNRGLIWNQKILEAISKKTKVVAIPQHHWADGTYFNLKAIREKTKKTGTYLIIDGTQSIGAFPFQVQEIQPDALICAGYKWLMGPYSIGVAYFSDEFCEGIPLEENWINRKDSEDFSQLIHYNETYQPKAGRYNVGEASNFILTPMLSQGIKQLLDWTPQAIQTYCKYIANDAIVKLQNLGYFIENENFRANHLFGIYLPKNKKISYIKEKLVANNISVSFRGNAVRVSPNVYNTKKDLKKLVSCFQ